MEAMNKLSLLRTLALSTANFVSLVKMMEAMYTLEYRQIQILIIVLMLS
jgi:hypothetical protein